MLKDRNEYLLKNAFLPFDDQFVSIWIENGIIKKIAREIQLMDTQATVIDLNKRIVIPGFVDGHMHLDKALLGDKVTNKSGTLTEAIQIMRQYKKSMTKEEVKKRAEKLIEYSLKNGTRFIRTHIDIDDEIQLHSLDALLELKEKYKKLIEIQIVAFPQEGINENPKNLFYLEEALKRGADLIGGIPAVESDPVKHIKHLFALANKYNVDIDMHVDETDDPDSLTIKDLSNITMENGYESRVTAGHLCSMAAHETKELDPIVRKMMRAKINVISLPSTNLYLQGRKDKKNIRRGIAPIKYLYEKGIPVMIGSDNIQDPFNPFGNSNLLEEALIAAHGTHMGGERDLEILFDMTTVIPGRRLKFNYQLNVGEKANFIVLNAYSKAEAIIKQVGIYGHFLNGNFIIDNQ